MAVNFFPDAGTSTGGGVTGDYIPLTQRGSANGVATLDSSAKVPQSQLPNISITDTFVVDSESEMLELIAQKGDIAVRTDNNKTFILQSTPATSLSNWVELPTPTDGVFSVDGKIGTVVLSNDYQAKSNELSALSALSDTPGFIKKISDGIYAIDSSSYLTTTSASASYQPLNSGLTSIGGLTIDGFLVKVGGAWGMDTNSYQIQDGDLTAIASLSTTGYLEKTGTNTWRTVPGPFQPLDSDLTDIAALTGNGVIRKTAGVWGIDSANYQLANNELSGFSALPDIAGLVRKTGDGVYSLDSNTYLTTSSATSSYQPLNAKLTGISGVTGTSGFLKQTEGVWGLDGSTYITGNQNITLSGDVTGSGTTAISVTLPNIVTAGSSAKPTYNSKGLVTGSGSLIASDIPTLDSTKVTGVVDIASTQTVTGQKTLIGGVIINDTIVESSISATELFTSWQPATGWTISGAEVSHTTGVDSITGNLASNLVLNEVYRIALNVANRTAGSITLGFAGNSIPTIATTSTLDLPVFTTGNTFSFLPTTDFNGTVSLSVRLINPSSSLVSGINGIKGRFSSTFLGLGTSLYRIQSLSNGCSFMGVNAGQSNTTGYNNSFMGVGAGRSNTTGYSNSFMGGAAGYANTTGYSNSFMGVGAGQSNTTGNANIFLGFEAGYNSTTESNALFIANNRTFTLLKGDGINLATTAVLRVNGTVASTSTTTGAVTTPGGVGVGGALFAQSLNGQLVLNRYTTATRPVASAGRLGQVWLNTDTGKIEYVATSSTIQVITSA